MTSQNGNIFRVTGHLCGEFIGLRWIPRTRASDAELWCFLWSALEYAGWVSNHEAGDLRRHCPHYDVTVMDYFYGLCGYINTRAHPSACVCQLATDSFKRIAKSCHIHIVHIFPTKNEWVQNKVSNTVSAFYTYAEDWVCNTGCVIPFFYFSGECESSWDRSSASIYRAPIQYEDVVLPV